MMGEAIRTTFFRSLEDLREGALELRTPDGRTRAFGQPSEHGGVRMEIRDWRVLGRLALYGDHGFLDDYRAGLWDTSDLVGLLSLALRNEDRLDRFLHGAAAFRALQRLLYLGRLNTVRGSRRNIHAHYDLGNDFYALWLDPTMTYSSALYAGAGESLLQAQYNKYDRVLQRLEAERGTLLEIGCGWGGFAGHALHRSDFGITGITLSSRQLEYARARLGRDADLRLQDYRDLEGRFDRVVSIEMFEAVGERYWAVYFRKLASLLKDKGRAVLQTITIDESRFQAYRRGCDVIRSHVFPGGMLPSPARFHAEARRAGLRSAGEFHFGADYARTLEDWLENFERNLPAVRALGYDESFIRLWRFYLASCIAGFRTGRTSVMQVELSHV